MTFKDLATYIEKLIEISNTDSMAGIKAKDILSKNVTTYEVEQIKPFIKAYERNR